MVNNIIETFNLSKKYKLKGQEKGILALNNVNLAIHEGEVFGLLGPNGSGKTTMVKILTTLLQPTNGYVIIDGYNILKKPREVKKKIGLMLGGGMIYWRITGYDNLKFYCKIYDIPDYKNKINNITKEFGLEKWLKQYVAHYSLGMKIKLALCRVLILDSEILFLDEPTLGLDVKSTLFVIEKLKELNKTIFLTSHNMNVIDKLCNRIAFINKGEILKVGTKEDLKKFGQFEVKIIIEIDNKKNQLKQELAKEDFIGEIIDLNNSLIITLNDRKHYTELFLILSKYHSIKKIREQEPSLENLFLKIT